MKPGQLIKTEARGQVQQNAAVRAALARGDEPAGPGGQNSCARTPDVWDALQEQEQLIESLGGQVKRLHEKMATVMRPAYPMTASQEQEERPTVIGQRLQKHNSTLRDLVGELEQMLDRVEL